MAARGIVHLDRCGGNDMNDDELAELHLRLIAGDTSVLLAIQTALRGRVLGLLRTSGVADADAEEVWNDAFLAAIERAPTLEPLGIGLRRFLMRVARNRGVDRVRGAINRNEVELDPSDGQRSGRVTPMDPDRAAAVQRCVDAARPVYAAVMEMTARGLTASEIAVVLDKSEVSVAKTRERARRWFADCLSGVIS
jgi:DNA-directed RNA polymerase specialized sigma24 family protein